MTSSFAPALASLDGLVPHAGILSIDELEEVAQGITGRPSLWRPLIHADPGQRRYELVYEDDRMDAWVLSWMPGQATGFHDHYISGVGLCVAAGSVIEDQMVYGAEHLTRLLEPGDTRQGGPGYIHRVAHASGMPAVTVHVYSPRLDWVGQYRLADDGVVRREVQPGRNELTAQRLRSAARGRAAVRF